ncbi:unnamed protein product, partial [Symbiodinium microadriaticum]
MSDPTEGNYSDPFVSDVVAFVAADDFQTKFENFFMEHAHKFSDDEEHQLFYYELYQEFQEMFDHELQVLCDSMGITKE